LFSRKDVNTIYYIYIYIERERKWDIERKRERERDVPQITDSSNKPKRVVLNIGIFNYAYLRGMGGESRRIGKKQIILVLPYLSEAVFSFLELELALGNRKVCELRVLGCRKNVSLCACVCVCRLGIGFHTMSTCQVTGNVGDQKTCTASLYCNILQVCAARKRDRKAYTAS